MCAPDSTSIDRNNNSKRQLAATPAEANEALTNVTSTTPCCGDANETSQASHQSMSLRRSHSFSEASVQVSAGVLLSVFFVVFAIYFPFILAPKAAEATYHLAWFEYSAELSHFDNTFWTWGTDYFLALAMAILIWSFPKTTRRSKSSGSTTSSTTTTTVSETSISISHVHTFRSQGMLFCYLLSVLAGGAAHQNYLTVESQGHWSFRFLWTICVGTVTLAPLFMGSIATELNHIDRETRGIDKETLAPKSTSSIWTLDRNGRIVVPSVPAWFWLGYAICSLLIVMWGGISFQRPACDIFVAGITQSPSTFYLMAMFLVGLPQFPNIPRWTRVLGAASFILNAPLLPIYPLLVQYTDWELGTVNLFLHSWLFVTWSIQGLTLRQMAIALEQQQSEPMTPHHSTNGSKLHQA